MMDPVLFLVVHNNAIFVLPFLNVLGRSHCKKKKKKESCASLSCRAKKTQTKQVDTVVCQLTVLLLLFLSLKGEVFGAVSICDGLCYESIRLMFKTSVILCVRPSVCQFESCSRENAHHTPTSVCACVCELV